MEKTRLRIRKFKKEDANGVSNVICRAQREILINHYTKKTVDAFCSWSKPSDILEKSKTREYYVAVEKEKIIGVVGYKEGKLRTMFVHPKHHKKGIGRKLVAKIQDVARKKGLKTLKVDSTNYAEPFYMKCGFKKVEKARVMYKGIRFYTIRMKMKL